MSPEARLMCGIILVLVPTIVFGGLTVLGVLSRGKFGMPGPGTLTLEQVALYRAGHAHAGVLSILALFLQIALDHAALPNNLVWPLRISAMAAALCVSGGFFGIAHVSALRALLYIGAFLVAGTALSVGVGLLRA